MPVAWVPQQDVLQPTPLSGPAVRVDGLDMVSCDVEDAPRVGGVEAAGKVVDDALGIVGAAENVCVAVLFPFLALSQPPWRLDRVLSKTLIPWLSPVAQAPGTACASGHDRGGGLNELPALPTCDP